MAYLAFNEAAPAAGPVVTAAAIRAPKAPVFSPLEWSVVALARRDSLSSLRAPGRVSMAMGALFGEKTNPRLADPRLEALRRIAVLTWHHGYTVPVSELRRFFDAGFDAPHYELLADSIAVDRTRQRGVRA
jgi:hypothetical protein